MSSVAMQRTAKVCATVYALLVRLYPDGFQRRFREQMVLDFEDGCADAGGRSMLTFAAHLQRTLVDWCASLTEEWMKTRTPAIVALTACVTSAAWAALLFVASREWPGTQKPLGRQWPPDWVVTPAGRAYQPLLADEQSALILMAAAAFVLILMVFVLAWLSPIVRRRPASKRAG